MNVYEVFKERTTVGEPDWHQDRDDLVLNNPHPAFDGFINISPTDEGTYEACAYEFLDPDGEEIIEVDAEIFKTQKEAKEWAETWRP